MLASLKLTAKNLIQFYSLLINSIDKIFCILATCKAVYFISEIWVNSDFKQFHLNEGDLKTNVTRSDVLVKKSEVKITIFITVNQNEFCVSIIERQGVNIFWEILDCKNISCRKIIYSLQFVVFLRRKCFIVLMI